MRLFLSETFFDAVFKLPKKTQDKVVTFQKKFRENPASPGIHLEPITQFKNSTMRTARVDDNYRVVIGVLDGNTYSLLYVADHEEAYRWGMSKRFVWNEHTQACQLISVEEKEQDYTPTPQTVTESTFFTGVPEEKLLKIGIPQEAIGRVMSIKSLDDLDALEPILPIDAYENIFNIISYPNDTSNIIIIINPIATPIVDKLECFPSCEAGINSSTTTYIIAPAAKESKYGSTGTTNFVSNIVIIAPIGSTIPDNVPYKKALLFFFPSAFNGIEIIAPSGKF